MNRALAWIAFEPRRLAPDGIVIMAGASGILSANFWRGPRSAARTRAWADQFAATRFQASLSNPPGQGLRFVEEAVEELRAYFDGKRSVFDVSLDLSEQGTAFEQAVWEALLTIPHGSVVSYGDVGAKIGRKSASRAVGRAIGRNPLPILVPCHRVVGKQGHLTGFSAGLRFKEILLELEGIALSPARTLSLRRVLNAPRRQVGVPAAQKQDYILSP